MAGLRPDKTSEVGARLLRTLHALSVEASRSLEPDQLIELVAEHACELLHGDAVALYLWDDAARQLVPVFSSDTRHPSVDQPLHPGEGAAGQAVLLREPIVVDDYANWPHAVSWAAARGVTSAKAVPLVVGDRSIGALVILFYGQHQSPGGGEMLQVLAAQVAPALEAARLYATSQLEREHERALREITQALAANLDERQVLDLAVSYGARLLRAPYARVWVFGPSGELSCAAAEGYVYPETFTERLANDSTSGLVARQQIVNLANAPGEPGWKFNRDFGQRTGLGAYLGAGLWRAGESLGVLELMRATGDGFNDLEEQLLLSLANAVAVAVSNARTHAAAERLAYEAEQRAAIVERSELLLRSIYEAIGAGVLVFDAEGKVINANAAASEVLGRPVDELLALGFVDLSRAMREDGSPMPVGERPYERAVATRAPVRKVVLGMTQPDARLRWLQTDAVPLLGSNGEVSRVISSFIDVTDARQANAALHQRDAILEAVAFAAEQLLMSSEWRQSLDAVLQRLGEATGVSRVYIIPSGSHAEHAGAHQWVAQGVRPRPEHNDASSYLQAAGLGRWEPILRDGGIIQGLLEQFSPDEQVVLRAHDVCSTVVVPIFAGNEWLGLVGLDDTTEQRSWPPGAVEVLKTAAGTLGAAFLRRRADAERLQLVREQTARAEAEAGQRRLAFLADASQLLAASLDYEASLQSVSQLVVNALADACLFHIREGSQPPRRVAWALADVRRESVQVPDDEAIEAVIERAEPSHSASRLIVPLVTRSGSAGAMTWLATSAGRVFWLQDLDLAKDLARRCALAVDNARLYREARAAVSLRDEFLSVAAHELKTPMTSLRGYAQLLGREFDKGEVSNPDRARRAAVTIQVQSDKLARLVGQLLDVSRIQSGKLAIERKQTDLSCLVMDVVEAVRAQLKNHALVANLPRDVSLFIDPLRVEQVLTNLLDNAIKFSPEGGQIDVVLADRPNCVHLSVRDHGVGVPAEHREHIFDRFYQAHAGGPLTGMAGMGLGLYISRQIVELHGGNIEADFPDDGGTRFVVTLPR